jgi:hypothetical protein
MNDEPLIGAKVLSADGEELGTVMEIDRGCFKVDARLQPDYWLAPDIVARTTPATVVLLMNKDDIGDAIDSGTEHTGRHFHEII